MAGQPNRTNRDNPPFWGSTHRSALLNSIRENRCLNLQLSGIEDHVVEFAKDPMGSKFILRKLSGATERRKGTIFREVRPNLLSLMKDAFGNYVVQKIFEIGAETQRHELRRIIQTEFMEVSMHKYGCRVVQTAIEKSAVHQQIFMIQSVFPNDLVELAKNVNGNHVMQQLFRCVPLNVQDYLFDRVKNQIIELCLDSYGCHVVECILADGSPAHRSEIFECFARNANQLIEIINHPYGNYVVQNVIQYCAPADKDRLAGFIIVRVVELAGGRHASNVVERCLNDATPVMKNLALFTICNQSAEDIKALCTDEYANFVIQKLVMDSEDVHLVANLYELIQPN